MVAVEGIDGAGKTLLCAALAERLRGHGLRVHLLDRRTLATEADFAGRRMAELRGVIWPAEAEPSDDALGTHVYLYLLAAWFVGLSRLTRGIIARHDIVLTDGSFYRVVAKAHARAGLDRDWLFGLFAHALRPDRVLLLDLDPALAWQRRSDFKATEIGRWDGQDGDARSGFVTYQGVIRAALLDFAAGARWSVLAQDAATTPHALAGAAASALSDLIRPSRTD